jgi:two-component system phosphate regulon response regulator PhoB
MSRPARLLIVDDEPDLLDILEFNLTHEGFAVSRAETGAEAEALLKREPLPELVILDLMLPDTSGVSICHRIRSNPATKHLPVLMLTAKDSADDKVVGFEMGADDYVTKPFSVREVILRVRALLRRSVQGDASSGASVDSEQLMHIGPLQVDIGAHRVSVEGVECTLTALEFRLVSTLVERAGRVQTRERLLEDVWEMRADTTTRTVDTHVTRLRRKLGVAGPLIETIRGVGYRCKQASEV